MIGTTIAGGAGAGGAAFSQLNNPSAIFVDSNRTMFILDTSNFRVLRWNFGEPRGHLVLGGNGNGPALNQLGWSYGMFVDPLYNIYVSDSSNHRVTLWLVTNRTSSVLVTCHVTCIEPSASIRIPRWRVVMVQVIHQRD